MASACALTVLAVPIGIVALMIYVDDKGNPFFSQVRLTKDGKPFKMYKLRTMCMDAEKRFAEVQKENQTDGLAFIICQPLYSGRMEYSESFLSTSFLSSITHLGAI